MPEPRLLLGAEALREALDLCMAADPSVYVLGEGVTDPKAIYGTTEGLLEKYGAERVVEMPVSENGLTGVAIGSALLGQRPVMVHQRVDFSLLSLEQLFNNAAKAFYVSNGRHRVPMVVRLIIGRGWGQGPAHSQSLEPVFAHIPGLKVLMPSSPYEAKGMLSAAIEDDNPVIILEHRWIHLANGVVPEKHFTVPLTGPARIQEGGDVTIVATSYMLFETLQAATVLRDVDVHADVFDLRVLRPLSIEPIMESIERTGRLIMVDTGWRTYGIGAEIVSIIAEKCFESLKAPPVRLGLPDYPTPSSAPLTVNFYPTSVSILDAVIDSVGIDRAAIATNRDDLIEERGKIPFDVPNPAFRGPF